MVRSVCVRHVSVLVLHELVQHLEHDRQPPPDLGPAREVVRSKSQAGDNHDLQGPRVCQGDVQDEDRREGVRSAQSHRAL